MENKIIKSLIDGKEYTIQLLQLDNSIYLNIGENELSFSNLLFAIPTKFDPIPNLRSLIQPKKQIPEWQSEVTEKFVKSLSKKLDVPVYCSIDLELKEELEAMVVLAGIKKAILAQVNGDSEKDKGGEAPKQQ